MFTFDFSFDKNCEQEYLYNQCCKEIINNLMKGFNCTIFAYGQTGTGKTYTMEGGEQTMVMVIFRWE